MSILSRIFNKGVTATPLYGANSSINTPNNPKNLSSYISPVQLQRLRHDVKMWRESIAEAEFAYYPFRVKMQQMYIDTILNGHVAALMERRQDLTMLRDFKIVDAKGEKSDVLTQQLKEAEWFENFILYALDAEFFGYSLISLGDIKNDQFTDVSIVRRWCVSPDRKEATQYIYQNTGNRFDSDPWRPWHVYVKTRSENGVSPCGYGLFYKIALYEIYLRNTLGYNGDFVELYAQPYRVGKTTKTTESERGELEAAIKNMGSSGWAIIDPMDEISFLETALGGTGYKGYESLEQRCQKTVSKLILGHADAMDSTPGKLGTGGDKEDNPVTIALLDKQTKDGRKIERIVNKDLAPRCLELGLKIIPEGFKFEFNNDAEKEEYRRKEDESNAKTADIFQTIKNAGGKPDWKYFTERTGIPVEEAPEPAPMLGAPGQKPNPLGEKTKNRLRQIYNK